MLLETLAEKQSLTLAPQDPMAVQGQGCSQEGEVRESPVMGVEICRVQMVEVYIALAQT